MHNYLTVSTHTHTRTPRIILEMNIRGENMSHI